MVFALKQPHIWSSWSDIQIRMTARLIILIWIYLNIRSGWRLHPDLNIRSGWSGGHHPDLIISEYQIRMIRRAVVLIWISDQDDQVRRLPDPVQPGAETSLYSWLRMQSAHACACFVDVTLRAHCLQYTEISLQIVPPETPRDSKARQGTPTGSLRDPKVRQGNPTGFPREPSIWRHF